MYNTKWKNQSEKVTYHMIPTICHSPQKANYGARKEISDCLQLRVRVAGKWIGATQRILRTMKILCMITWWWTHVNINLSNTLECTISSLKYVYSIKYILWVIMMCPCRFFSFNKYTTVVRDVDNGGGLYMCRGREYMEISFLSFPSMLLWTWSALK